jgi:hypothetical protein
MSSQPDKTPVRLRRFEELGFVPRFEYGDMAESAELYGLIDGTRLGTPNVVPPRPFLDIGVRVKFAWEIWKARAEAWSGPVSQHIVWNENIRLNSCQTGYLLDPNGSVFI